MVSRHGESAMSEPARPRPWWRQLWRFLWRMAVLAIPFTVLFGTLFGGGWQGYITTYKMSLVFAYVIGFGIWAEEVWLDPILRRNPNRRTVLLGSIVARTPVGTLGSFLAAFLINRYVVHGVFGSGRSLVILLLFSLLFSALFIGIGLATHYYGAYLDRVREEERFKARVE